MKGFIGVFSVIVVVFCLAVPVFGQERTPLTDKKERQSYAIGVAIAKSVKAEMPDINPAILAEAFKDVFSGGKLRLTEAEMAEIRLALEKEMAEKTTADLKAGAEKNRKDEERFLAENKARKGVVTLPSGLQYEILKEGTGKTPKEDDLVSVHYRVSLIDGTEIEDSSKKGEPGTFTLEEVIPGWREGVCLMKSGSKFRLFVPSKLAYGEEGAGELVGPNTALVFDLELLSVLDKPKEKAAENGEGR